MIPDVFLVYKWSRSWPWRLDACPIANIEIKSVSLSKLLGLNANEFAVSYAPRVCIVRLREVGWRGYSALIRT